MRSRTGELHTFGTVRFGLGLSSWCDRPMRPAAPTGRLWLRRVLAEKADAALNAAQDWTRRSPRFTRTPKSRQRPWRNFPGCVGGQEWRGAET